MAVSFPQSPVASGTSAFATDGIDALSFASAASVGDRVYVGISLTATNRTITSVVDDGSNTYTLVSDGTDSATIELGAAGVELWLYAADVTTTMQTVTATISSALASPSIWFIVVVRGQHASTPNEDVATATQPTATTSHPCGPVSTASADSGLIGFIAGTNGTYNNESGWTSIYSNTNFHAAYRTIGAASTTWTVATPGNENTASVLLAIAPAAAGGFQAAWARGANILHGASA